MITAPSAASMTARVMPHAREASENPAPLPFTSAKRTIVTAIVPFQSAWAPKAVP